MNSTNYNKDNFKCIIPGYPCDMCENGEICSDMYCPRWRDWFRKAWRTTTNSIKDSTGLTRNNKDGVKNGI